MTTALMYNIFLLYFWCYLFLSHLFRTFKQVCQENMYFIHGVLFCLILLRSWINFTCYLLQFMFVSLYFTSLFKSNHNTLYILIARFLPNLCTFSKTFSFFSFFCCLCLPLMISVQSRIRLSIFNSFGCAPCWGSRLGIFISLSLWCRWVFRAICGMTGGKYASVRFICDE